MTTDIYEFTHPDGRSLRANPRAIQKFLELYLDAEINEVLTAFYGRDVEAAILATDKLSSAVCKTFGLPLDTPPPCWCTVLWDFLEWMEKNVEKAANSPT